MAKIFDQEQPKSALAQSLNAAFAGCDVWTVAPSKRRAVDAPILDAPSFLKPPEVGLPPR